MGKASSQSQKADSAHPSTTTKEDDMEAKKKKRSLKHNDSKAESSVATTTSKESMKLKKELGLMEGVTMIIGIVIGSGIFVSPKGVILYTGSVGMSLAVWAVSGLVSMVGALCFAELGTMIPESGGSYSYLYESFGAFPAFLYMWITVYVKNSAGVAVLGLTFSNYLLQPFVSDVVPDVSARLIATVIICFLSWVNCINVRWVASVQNAFTATKMLALVVIIIVGVYSLASGEVENYLDPMAGTKWQAGAIATAFYQSLFSYSGWENLYYVVEELKNPDRNVPLAIVISTTLVTIVYTLTNVAYLAVLSPTEMLSSNAVAMTFASKTLGVMAWIMPVFVMCSVFGSMNGAVFTQSRLIFVGARRGQFPEVFTLLHTKYFTPITSIILNAALSLIMFVTSDIGLLINYATFALTVSQVACMFSLFWFRYKQPDRARPFKVWLILPVISTLASIFLVVMPLIENPIEVGIAIGIVFSGIPVYYFCIYRQDLVDKCSGFLGKITIAGQIIFHSLPEDKEA